ncbi:hypothetical protein [Paraflavitalea pollutisoli]|uniref:hypothetical protein n=1 Tax=Paraflavitalea pollutisoli TaxID=3034143 RepID=UPI0023EDC300|nr:hypothetical protein [Paraflavitalea sp. H1-2-19X]
MPLLRLFNDPDRQFAAVFTLATLGVWGFIWSHAWGMDMTHDEAYSFYLVKTNYFRAMPGSANTHWLNSFFMLIWHSLLGDAPGLLRLHSVLAFPFFAWAVFLLGKHIDGAMGRIAFYALVLFNPYVLDFFSLARGYGLAMTFQAWSIVWFIRAASMSFSWRSWRWVLLFNTLAIAANLSYFYTVVGMAGFAGWLSTTTLAEQRAANRGFTRLLSLYSLLLLLTGADLLFIKFYGKDLSYGGNEQFVQSLFGSVWKGSLYRVVNGTLSTYLAYLSLLLIVGISGWYLWLYIRQKKPLTGLLLAVPLISLVLLNLLFHVALENPFLLFRTALQWYVPGMLLICYAASDWKPELAAIQWTGTVIAGVVAFVFVGQFMKQVNRQWCYEWPLQANSKQALQDLYARQPRQPALGYSLMGSYINYYSQLPASYQPAPVYLPDEGAKVTDTALIRILRQSDYVVSGHAVTLQCLEKLGLRYDIVNEYPPGQNVLIRIRK